jgi:putative endonuclease
MLKKNNMEPTNTRDKGTAAEEMAVQFLLDKGYEILERNWYHHHHEIDIIARKGNIVSIVEVRSLSYNYIQEPYQTVNRNKQRMIISATNAYILKHNIRDEVRFDVISILFSKSESKIEHIENAFYPRVR